MFGDFHIMKITYSWWNCPAVPWFPICQAEHSSWLCHPIFLFFQPDREVGGVGKPWCWETETESFIAAYNETSFL